MAQTESQSDKYWEDLNKTYESKFRSLKCFLKEKDSAHFLIDPKILPCSNTACFECIRTSMANSTDLNCSLCKQVHANLNLNELKSNDFLIDQIETNSNEITCEMIEKLNKYIAGLTG